MGLFDKLFGKKPDNTNDNTQRSTKTDSSLYEINATKDGVFVNGSLLSIPLNIDELIRVFGEPRLPQVAAGEDFKGTSQVMIWDNSGIYAFYKDDKTATLDIQFEFDQDWEAKDDIHKWRPHGEFQGSFFVNGTPYREIENDAYLTEKKTGNWVIYFGKMQNPVGKNHFRNAEIVYEKPRASTGKYKQNKIDGEPLYFKNFNFKLAIIQALMFDQELLKPKFDVYDFAEDYVKRKIDIDSEGYEPIPEIKKYFRDLPIDKRLAAKITELYLDGGNDIYLQVCPLWDGEDSIFDIKAIEEAELVQFPNLKKITDVMMRFSKTTRELLQSCGIEIVEE
jgi:hypothetical protein